MLEKAGLALESAQASVRALDRKLEAADKEEAALKVEIRLYTLTAPRKGRLGRLQVVIGQTLPAGAAVAEVVGIDDEIDVLCFVSAADARKLQVGQRGSHRRLRERSRDRSRCRPGREGRLHRGSSRGGDGLLRRQSPLPQSRPEAPGELRGARPGPDEARQGLLGGARIRTHGRPGPAGHCRGRGCRGNEERRGQGRTDRQGSAAAGGDRRRAIASSIRWKSCGWRTRKRNGMATWNTP